MGLTQEALAEKTGLTARHFQQIETGKRLGLRLVTVDRLAVALGVTTAELLEPGRFTKPVNQRGRSGYRIER